MVLGHNWNFRVKAICTRQQCMSEVKLEYICVQKFGCQLVKSHVENNLHILYREHMVMHNYWLGKLQGV